MTIDSPQSEIPSLLLKPEADPKPTGLTQPQSFIPEMPYGFISPLPQPDRMTNIELERLYDNPNTEASMWLPEKIWHGITKETMTGEAVRDFFLSPRFSPDPSFSVTPSLIEKYASDLSDPDGSPLNPNSRIFENVKSLPQFLHEIHDYRVTQERRKAMFSGGISGMIGGFIGMAASGLEAAAVTAGAGALGTFVGTPATGIAASAATAASKVNRFRAIWNAVSSSGRARAIGKAGVITAGVDVPIELAKYAMDPTLSKTDLLIGIAGAGVVGGGIAAVRLSLIHI